MSWKTKGLRRVLELPANLWNRLETIAKVQHCVIAKDVVFFTGSRVGNDRGMRDAISIGAHSRISGQLLTFAHGGSIQIGESCYIGENTRIWSSASITIGNGTLISHNVNIHDNNAHSLSALRRREHFVKIFRGELPTSLDDVASRPIVIEDDVWIGFNCTILKGVTIGTGAVIGAGTMITKDVPAYSIVVGNPPRIIGQATP